MRKKIIAPTVTPPGSDNSSWLDLAQAVEEVEVSSEDAGYPVENALLPGIEAGWRAAGPGPQTIRLRFGQPRRLQRIVVEFAEKNLTRTQEFCLRWSADQGKTYREIVRQQWNFSPDGASREIEDYRIPLDGVTMLELEIVPEIGGGDSVASLARMRLA
jgi:hypothetical protein